MKKYLLLLLFILISSNSFSYRSLKGLSQLIFESELIVEGKFISQMDKSKYLFVVDQAIAGRLIRDTLIIKAPFCGGCGMPQQLMFRMKYDRTLLFLNKDSFYNTEYVLEPDCDGVIYNYVLKNQMPVKYNREEIIQAIKVIKKCYYIENTNGGEYFTCQCKDRFIGKAKTYSDLLNHLIKEIDENNNYRLKKMEAK